MPMAITCAVEMKSFNEGNKQTTTQAKAQIKFYKA